jgi:hypothetical protein
MRGNRGRQAVEGAGVPLARHDLALPPSLYSQNESGAAGAGLCQEITCKLGQLYRQSHIFESLDKRWCLLRVYAFSF